MQGDSEASPSENPRAESVRNVLRGAVLLPLLMMSLLSGLLVWNVKALLGQSDWVTHTERVIAETNRAQKLLLDQETGLRGYMLTGELPFLDPYTKGHAELPEALAKLQGLAADNASQQGRIGDLRKRYDVWSQSAEEAIALVRSDPSWTARSRSPVVEAMRRRKVDMDEMRAVVTAMIFEEQNLLLARRSSVGTATRVTIWGGSALLLLVGVSVAVAFRRWLAAVERVYRRALEKRAESEESERRARHAAEALAEEIAEQCRDLEKRFTEMRDEKQSGSAARGG